MQTILSENALFLQKIHFFVKNHEKNKKYPKFPELKLNFEHTVKPRFHALFKKNVPAELADEGQRDCNATPRRVMSRSCEVTQG